MTGRRETYKKEVYPRNEWAEALKAQKAAGSVGGQGTQTWVRLGIFHGEFGSPEKWLDPRILWNFLLVHNNLKVIGGGSSWV